MTAPSELFPSEGEGDPTRLSPARRRRQRRRLIPQAADERAAFLERLAERAYPTAEFFLLCLLAGAIMGAGWLFDSQALLFVGVLLIPVLGPWVGMALATVTGSWRFFFQTLASFLIGALMIFVIGLVTGWAARAVMPITLNEAFYHSRLWWPHLAILLLGAILFPISFVRSERHLLLPSAMLAFALFLPLSAAGLGLTSGVPGLWPDGIIVFLIHFGLASLVGVVTLAFMGFRPYTLAGYSLGTALILVAILALVLVSGFGTALAAQFGLSPMKPTHTVQASVTPTAATVEPVIPLEPTRTPTRRPATATATLTRTATAALASSTAPTATGTPSPQPTPFYARVFSPEGGGLTLRDEPGGLPVTTLVNGILVEIISDVELFGGYNWVKVRAVTGGSTFEGWVIQSLLELATPAATWLPSPTP
jgi:hypothetical protein